MRGFIDEIRAAVSGLARAPAFTALAVGVSGPMMAVTGFAPNEVQTEQSLFGLRILFAGMPCAGFLIGAWLFRGFRLDDEPPIPPAAALKVPSTP
mgnify:CR=1 FL=1